MKEKNKRILQSLQNMKEMPGDQIDYSDIPEMSEDFFSTAQLINPPKQNKKQITIQSRYS